MKFLGFLIGILLLPACVAVTRTVLLLIQALPSAGTSLLPAPALAFAAGFFAWFGLFAFLPKNFRTYVFAHELTHALWGMLMGAKVSHLKVSQNGGSVRLSKTNFLITLAPYFFPLYTVLVVLLFLLLSLFWDMNPYYLVWLGLTGFTWSFHITCTIHSLMQHQTDIQACGQVFSYSLIFLFNLLGVALWIVLVTPVTWRHLAAQLWADCRLAYGWCWLFLHDTIKWAAERFL